MKNQPFDLAVEIESENNSIATNERDEEQDTDERPPQFGGQQVDSGFKNSTFERKGDGLEEGLEGEEWFVPGQ